MATSGGALSSVGRASRLHREGRRFEPVSAHHEPSFRSRVGASDPSSRERTFHADQTRWLVPLRRGSLFGTQSYAGSVLALLLFDLSQTRSEEHTSELQSLMRNSYAVFCLKKKK